MLLTYTRAMIRFSNCGGLSQIAFECQNQSIHTGNGWTNEAAQVWTIIHSRAAWWGSFDNFSSPEPKAVGEVIGSDSGLHLCVQAFVYTFKLEYLLIILTIFSEFLRISYKVEQMWRFSWGWIVDLLLAKWTGFTGVFVVIYQCIPCIGFYQLLLILTALLHVPDKRCLSHCMCLYIYQVMMTLHFLNDIAIDT